MRNLLLLITAVFTLNLTVYGQTDSLQTVASPTPSEFKTIFHPSGKGKIDITGFGALNMDFASLDNNFDVIGGLDLAVLFNKSFFVGAYGRMNPATNKYTYTYYNANDRVNQTVTQRALFGHGGLLVGGVFFPNNAFHFGISGRFGVGGISMVDDFSYRPGPHPERANYDSPYSDPVFVFSPQVDFEMNVTHWLKFRISAGYQYVAGTSVMSRYFDFTYNTFRETEILNTSDYSSPTVSMGFVFGIFK
jgi:hypothetical protein